jgi:hypothetical protein
MKKLYYIMTLVFSGLLAFNIVGSTNVLADMLQVNFSTNPTIAVPGTVGYIEVDLKSTGSVVSYTDITATSSNPIVIIPQGNWDVEVGSLDNGASTSVIYAFRVPATASPGLYQVIFEITGAGGSIQQTAFVKVQDATVLDITSMSPTSITIGEATTMTFNITNNGGAALNNILFSWADSNNLILPVGTDNRILIPSIAAMNHTTLSVVMMASSGISPGIYPLTITMTYYDMTGTEQTVVSTVGLQITGTTSFDLVVSTSTTGSTTFSVVNTGANTASSVIVSIPQQPNYQVVGSSSASLGNLNAGDYTLASFQITSIARNTTSQFPGFNRTRTNGSQFRNFSGRSSFMNQSFAGFSGNGLLVQISYTDVFGIRQTIQKQVSMSSGSSSFGSFRSSSSSGSSSSNSFRNFGQTQSTSGSSNSLWYIGIGVAGIVIIIGIIQLGRKKKLTRLTAYFKGRKE